MDICVYVHVNNVIRCECVNIIIRGGGVVLGGASEIRQTWGAHVLKG